MPSATSRSWPRCSASASWGFLLRQYDASTVAPFSLLVPVVGMGAAWVLRGEAVGLQQAIAAALIIGGMACTVIRRRTPDKADSPEWMLTKSAA